MKQKNKKSLHTDCFKVVRSNQNTLLPKVPGEPVPQKRSGTQWSMNPEATCRSCLNAGHVWNVSWGMWDIHTTLHGGIAIVEMDGRVFLFSLLGMRMKLLK